MEVDRPIRVLDKLFAMEELISIFSLGKLMETLARELDVMLIELSIGIAATPGLRDGHQTSSLPWMVLQKDTKIDLLVLSTGFLIKHEHFKGQATIDEKLVHLSDEYKVFLISRQSNKCFLVCICSGKQMELSTDASTAKAIVPIVQLVRQAKWCGALNACLLGFTGTLLLCKKKTQI
jgi:hypothetical protein